MQIVSPTSGKHFNYRFLLIYEYEGIVGRKVLISRRVFLFFFIFYFPENERFNVIALYDIIYKYTSKST